MHASLTIVEGDLSNADVIALLGEPLQGMADLSPPESVHALDLRGLMAAHTLYEKIGFAYCGPFGDYQDDPFSRFMTLYVS